jgi:hypothetical protein
MMQLDPRIDSVPEKAGTKVMATCCARVKLTHLVKVKYTTYRIVFVYR